MNGSPERAQVVAQPAEELGHDKTLDVSAERVNSEAQTQHDPLCLHFVHIVEGGTACNCDFIAKVRADEREQAVQRVEAAIPHWSMCCTSEPPFPFHPNAEPCGSCCCVVIDAVAAARGEA